ncbi:MAG: hypothetical protein IJD02_00010 [Lachnospiraceae bacterium]|nr:hypothetical protein [Lachnospiraceae bacterium]
MFYEHIRKLGIPPLGILYRYEKSVFLKVEVWRDNRGFEKIMIIVAT